MNKSFITILFGAVCPLVLFASCKNDDAEDSSVGTNGTSIVLNMSTDKCAYKPGSTVCFTCEGTIPSGAYLRYRHLGDVVGSPQPLSSSSWTWTAPSSDYQGYMAEAYKTENDGTETILGTIGIDVSSDWNRFPRYGFVATYDSTKSVGVIQQEVKWLNRCHINGVQFQDWQYKHHWPAPVTHEGKLLSIFRDIANRNNRTEAIKNYISTQHGYGMKAMFYNLCFGALKDAAEDGVDSTWGVFTDPFHRNRDVHALVSTWKSSIYLVNPGHTDWCNYLAQRNQDVYKNFDFDGYQIDQLGGRGNIYDWNGNSVNLLDEYPKFINTMKEANPDKELVMNAVGGYGTEQFCQTGNVGFLYNEVWGDQEKFSDLRDILNQNKALSGGKLQTVFAAYMDYNVSNSSFNIPGVLLADAFMFAHGGSHLELGDHMLSSEYFPNTKCTMTKELKGYMEQYYDFLVAYENLLRGEGEDIDLTPQSTAYTINSGTPQLRSIYSYSRQVGSKKVIHLINFLNATSLSWRDTDGSQRLPRKRYSVPVTIPVTGTVNRIWFATPDDCAGAVQEAKFTQGNGSVTITLPNFRYWTMIVIE